MHNKDNKDKLDRISKEILYLTTAFNIKQSEIIEAYKKNDFNITRTLNSETFKNKNIQMQLENNKISDFDNLIAHIKKNNINVLNISEKIYPKLLKEIYYPPPVLFYKGNQILKSDYLLAVVGTRKCSIYGKDVAGYISRQLSKIGITIVSGMASGIDYWAQKAALEEKGGSIGILGCGIDIIYPPENKDLYNQLIDKGSLLTEFLPGTPPLKSNFPARNRIISGMSMGVVVIEAGIKSGALITGEFALNQNREVFAIPGSIFNPESQGCHKLIKNGAKLVENIDDILEEINQYYKNDISQCLQKENLENNFTQREKINILGKTLNQKQKLVFDCLGCLPKSIEKIVCETKFNLKEVLQIISELEVKELIKEKKYNAFVRL
ncbi:MAG: DNA-processing protein DprA [Actinobacteria bacterium]|nr:DNA-processing protein DprA [Actinomycetota bacterium]